MTVSLNRGATAGEPAPTVPLVRRLPGAGHWLALLVILLAAAALRFTEIGQLPAGFQHDEAAYAFDARNVVAGERQIFFERANGREPLFIYAVAGNFALYGVGVWQMRIVAAAFGLLTVAALYRLTADLFGPRAGLFAMAFVALAYWPIHVSHTAFRAVTLPFFVTIAALAFWRALNRGGVWRYALAGALLGLVMYTYASSRVLPVLVVAWLLAAWWFSRRGGARVSLAGVAALLAVMAAVFAPLGWYFLAHPDEFVLRAEQTNDLRPIMLEGDFRPLITDTLNTLGMFTVHGDDSWKYNLSGRPVFDVVSGMLFLAGLALVLVGLAGRAVPKGWTPFSCAMLLLWMVFMLAPAFVTGESPHFLRTIGALPVVFILPAIGLEWVVRRLGTVRGAAGLNRSWAAAIVAGFVAFGALSAYDLFVRWADAPEQRAFFRADYAAAEPLIGESSRPAVIAAEYPYDLDPLVMDLIAGRHVPVRWFDGLHGMLYPAVPSTLYTPAFARPPGLPAPARQIPGPNGQPGLAVYDSAALTPPAPAKPFERAVGDHLRLLGFGLPAEIRAGAVLTVPVSWEVTQGGAPGDLSFSLKLVGPWDSVWAQHDLSPVPPIDWQPGDRFTVYHGLALDAALAPGTYSLVGQVYRRGTLAIEPVSGGGPTDQYVLAMIQVERGAPAAQAKVEPRFATPAVFGDSIALVGYDIDKPVAAAGESLGVTLYWKALKGDLPDLTVFTHLIHDGEPTVLYGQRDSQPVYGAYPTTAWQAGEVIKDHYEIAIDPNAPAGEYHVAVGLYDRASGQRLDLQTPSYSLQDRLTQLLAKLGLPYQRERIEANRVLLKPNYIERR